MIDYLNNVVIKITLFPSLYIQTINILKITTKTTLCPRGEFFRHRELKR